MCTEQVWQIEQVAEKMVNCWEKHMNSQKSEFAKPDRISSNSLRSQRRSTAICLCSLHILVHFLDLYWFVLGSGKVAVQWVTQTPLRIPNIAKRYIRSKSEGNVPALLPRISFCQTASACCPNKKNVISAEWHPWCLQKCRSWPTYMATASPRPWSTHANSFWVKARLEVGVLQDLVSQPTKSSRSSIQQGQQYKQATSI